MTNTPSIEALEELALAAGFFERKLNNFVHSLVLHYVRANGRESLEELVDCLVELVIREHLRAEENNDEALPWLEQQLEVRAALKAIGLEKASERTYAEKFYDVLDDADLNAGTAQYFAGRIASFVGVYLRYMSGLARAMVGYLTGSRVRLALEGPALVERLRELIMEFQELASIELFEAKHRQTLARMVQAESVLYFLDSGEILGNFPSRRNDPDLAARLMAAEIIRLHIRMFNDPHKRAVFQLMGLPILDRPMEIRTIERLIQAEGWTRDRKRAV